MKTVLVVATLDTKGAEVAFCRERIEALGAKALLLDGGVLGEPTIKPDITREEVAAAAGTTIEQVRKIPAEGDAIGLQAQGAGVIALRLYKEDKIHGVLGIATSADSLDHVQRVQTPPLYARSSFRLLTRPQSVYPSRSHAFNQLLKSV